MQGPEQTPRRISISAAILAWIWPGMGHISLGERKRGALIMFGVLLLFLSGLLIGGFDCVDRRNATLWFYAQAFCGPITFVADYANPNADAADVLRKHWDGFSDLRRRYHAGDSDVMAMLDRSGLGHVNEIGTLFIALAGLMNFVVILDALYFLPSPVRDRRAPEAGA